MRKARWVVVGTIFCHAALAEVTYRVDAGVGYSDNILRVPTAPIDETIGMAGLDLAWLEKSKRLDADVTIGGDFLHYREHTFDDDFVGIANGTVTLGIVPDRITWLLQDSFGQAQADPFVAATPETRESVNYFTTGPDFVLNLGAANTVRLFGRYSLTDYEVSPFDGDRIGGGLILAHYFTDQSYIALQGVQEDVSFDDTPQSDFVRRDLFLSYDLQGARTQLTAEAGYSSITLQDDSETTGPLARLDVTRKLSASSTLVMSLGTQFSDASQALRGAVSGSPSDIPTGVTSTPAPFENTFADLAWRFSRNRTDFGLRASWNQDDYDEELIASAPVSSFAQQDRTRMVYEVNFARRLTPGLTLSLLGSLVAEEYDLNVTSDELHISGTLDWRFGRHVGISLTAESYDRTASNAIGEYREARGFLTLFYRTEATVGR